MEAPKKIQTWKRGNSNAYEELIKARQLAEFEAERLQMEAEAKEAAKAAQELAELEARVYGKKKTALYLNQNGLSNLLDRINTFCAWVPCTVEALEKYGLAVEPEAVRKYTLHPEQMKAAIIENVLSKYAFGADPYYKDYLRKKVSEDLAELEAFQERTKEAKLMEGPEAFTTWNPESKTFEANEEALKEAFTVYAEGQAAYLWDCLQDATDILNAVFNGKAPVYIGQLWSINPEEGVLHLRPEVNLRLWCKDPAEDLLKIEDFEDDLDEEEQHKPGKAGKASKKGSK